MKNTWLVSKQLSLFLQLKSLLSYTILINLFFFNSEFFKFSALSLITSSKLNSKISLFTVDKNITKARCYFLFSTSKNWLKISNDTMLSQTQKLKNQPSSINFLLSTALSFLYAFHPTLTLLAPHANWRLFGLFNYKTRALRLNPSFLFQRWKDAQNLLNNIFFFDIGTQLFSAPAFKNETLAFNWHVNTQPLVDWKYYSHFYYYKLHSFHYQIDFFFQKLKEDHVIFTYVTDCNYHARLLFYFRKHQIYTLGLVDYVTNPWLVSYPLPSLIVSSYTQYFFIKIIMLSYKNAKISQYFQFLHLWKYLFWTARYIN